MDRYIKNAIYEDLKSKIVLLSGPRQVGKTTLSKMMSDSFQYLNYDHLEDRKLLSSETWDRTKKLIIFDEIHKKAKWKSWIKGIYDVEGIPPSLLITGSARMDILKKGGDSLAGRHFSYRLHPLSVAEMKHQMPPQESLELLLQVGGFPEPFLKGGESFAKRWRASHIERIIREDVVDLALVKQIKPLEILVELLSERVGSPVSSNSLAKILEVSPHTIKRWIEVLELLYVVFVVPPYSKKLARTIQKEPKIYFYDTARVIDNPSLRLENLVACALLKHLHFREDTLGEKNKLYYVRDREKREVDFVTVSDNKLESLIEVKLNREDFSKNLFYFQERLKPQNALQLCMNLKQTRTTASMTKMQDVADYLKNLS